MEALQRQLAQETSRLSQMKAKFEEGDKENAAKLAKLQVEAMKFRVWVWMGGNAFRPRCCGGVGWLASSMCC